MDEQEFDDELFCDDTLECPCCGHENMPMGSLGMIMYYRCRMCGWDYSEEQEDAA